MQCRVCCRCSGGCASVGEFLQLVDDIVDADISFGLRAFAAFLSAIAAEAHAQASTARCFAGERAAAQHDLGAHELGRRVWHGQEGAAVDGDEFLQWSDGQALFSLQRAAWAIEEVLAFLASAWREEAMAMGLSASDAATTADAEAARAAVEAGDEWPWVREAAQALQRWQSALEAAGLHSSRPAGQRQLGQAVTDSISTGS
jgi:hypothetical protein